MHTDPTPIPSHDVARKHAGRTVIAHISDLHGRSTTNYAHGPWTALEQDLATFAGRVDLLVASGDLIDSNLVERRDETTTRNALENSERYVSRNLCTALQIDPNTSLCI